MGQHDGGVCQPDWVEIVFQHRNELGRDELHLTDVALLGPLHPDRGLEYHIQEATYVVGEGPFVRCKLLRVRGVLPEIFIDRLL